MGEREKNKIIDFDDKLDDKLDDELDDELKVFSIFSINGLTGDKK